MFLRTPAAVGKRWRSRLDIAREEGSGKLLSSRTFHLSLSVLQLFWHSFASKTLSSVNYPDTLWIMQQLPSLHPSFSFYLYTAGEWWEGKRWASVYTCLQGTVRWEGCVCLDLCVCLHERVSPLPQIGLHQRTKCAEMLKNTRSWKKRAAIAVTLSRVHNILYVLCDCGAQLLRLAAGLCVLN